MTPVLVPDVIAECGSAAGSAPLAGGGAAAGVGMLAEENLTALKEASIAVCYISKRKWKLTDSDSDPSGSHQPATSSTMPASTTSNSPGSLHSDLQAMSTLSHPFGRQRRMRSIDHLSSYLLRSRFVGRFGGIGPKLMSHRLQIVELLLGRT